MKKNISPKTHTGTLRQLAKEYLMTGLFSKENYDYLYGAMELRNDSSYNYFRVFTGEMAHELIEQAEKFIAEVETLL
ncbi:HEPN domain-containing protein [Methanobrevibacter olleyae]|uniref:HEPN domain-containing protein n=1 Tax=Methanobrevibacter olleyae TaxID=294671 RepID=A0A1I4KW81_METOL|nr:HEPN domain-containing protein [Methanobrevibacter olleyae]SFL82677.1 HEPN domain-containing protein [Methanobrevibacter olleyae]